MNAYRCVCVCVHMVLVYECAQEHQPTCCGRNVGMVNGKCITALSFIEFAASFYNLLLHPSFPPCFIPPCFTPRFTPPCFISPCIFPPCVIPSLLASLSVPPCFTPPCFIPPCFIPPCFTCHHLLLPSPTPYISYAIPPFCLLACLYLSPCLSHSIRYH